MKAILYALASSECSETPFLVGMILLVWEDTPWKSASIRSHRKMTTLIRITAGHMRFVPAHIHYDDAASELSLSKWLVEFVLISKEVGREDYLTTYGSI